MAPVRTFSIVAADPSAGECGVAVASKFLAAGAVVPWAKAGVGAIATQSYANVSYGPNGLAMLAEGIPPERVLERLVADDADAQKRQVGIVDMRGGSATLSGRECFPWYGGLTAPGVAVRSPGACWPRSRRAIGRVATVAVSNPRHYWWVRPEGGYGGLSDRYLDLRVDDHPHPVDELERLCGIWRLLFEKPLDSDFIPIDDIIATELREGLRNLGYDPGSATGPWDDGAQRALTAFSEMENLEVRLRQDRRTDRQVLGCFRELLLRRSALG